MWVNYEEWTHKIGCSNIYQNRQTELSYIWNNLSVHKFPAHSFVKLETGNIVEKFVFFLNKHWNFHT